VKTLFIRPDSPQENGYCESFNSKLRDELSQGEMFTTLREVQVLIENWRRHQTPSGHTRRLARPPPPEAILPTARGLPYDSLRSAHGSDSNSRTGTALGGRAHSLEWNKEFMLWPLTETTCRGRP
jgi:putative transposase